MNKTSRRQLKRSVSKTVSLAVLLLVAISGSAYLVRNQLDGRSKANLLTQEPGGISSLWGQNGEKWNKSLLPDYSFAGYNNSNTSIPSLPIVANVTQAPFNAVPNDNIDDDAAFQKAINETVYGAIYIPDGTYRFTSPLVIEKSNIELVGQSRDKTILEFRRSLQSWANSNFPSTTTQAARDALLYNFTTGAGGMLWFGIPASALVSPADYETRMKDLYQRQLTTMTAPAAKYATSIQVASTAGIYPGDYILIEVYYRYPVMSNPPRFDPINSPGDKLYSHLMGGDANVRKWLTAIGKTGRTQEDNEKAVSIPVKVLSAGGTTVQLAQPLPIAIETSWSPKVYRMKPYERVGIKNVTVAMPYNTTTAAHLTEKGYNGITFRLVANSWIKNVRLMNVDNGINFGPHAVDNTIDGVSFQTYNKEGRKYYHVGNANVAYGHHGFTIGTSRNLITNVIFDTKFGHEITVEQGAHHNVYSNIVGKQLVFDHHGNYPFENLFTNIEVGAFSTIKRFGSEYFTPYQSGGAGSTLLRSAQTAAKTTLWNVYNTRHQYLLKPSYYGTMADANFPSAIVEPSNAVPTGTLSDDGSTNVTVGVKPLNLFAGQLEKRLAARQGIPPGALPSVSSIPSPMLRTDHSQFQCVGFNVYRGAGTTETDRLYSNSITTLRRTDTITMRGAGAFALAAPSKIEYCWAPYMDKNGKLLDISGRNGAYFQCAPGTAPTRPDASKEPQTYKNEFSSTIQALIDRLPNDAARVAANGSGRLVMMIRMTNPTNSAHTCSANPSINSGFGSEYLPGKSSVSNCATARNGMPCNMVIGFIK